MRKGKSASKKVKYHTISFRPTPEVARVLAAAGRGGRGVRSLLINTALERHLPALLAGYEAWRGPTSDRGG